MKCNRKLITLRLVSALELPDFVLEKNFDYFLLDTPYAKSDSIIDNEIAAKLKKCNVTTLITVGKLIDVLIDQQEMIKKADLD